ncbi:hypothetical protein PI125_g12210 [Phytophthora idaei]|nr:hypothetical protein PI125_g12210 [Phytophthora idaei]
MPIVKGHMRSGQVLGLERFNGEGYTMWRDKVLAQIETLGEKYQRGGLEKDQPGAIVVMMDFLDGTPEKPVISAAGKFLKRRRRLTAGVTNTGQGLDTSCLTCSTRVA